MWNQKWFLQLDWWKFFRIANDNKLYDGCLLSAFNENAQYWTNKSTVSLFHHSACPSPLLPFSVEIPQIGRVVKAGLARWPHLHTCILLLVLKDERERKIKWEWGHWWLETSHFFFFFSSMAIFLLHLEVAHISFATCWEEKSTQTRSSLLPTLFFPIRLAFSHSLSLTLCRQVLALLSLYLSVLKPV